MNELALGMQVIECVEEMLQPAFEQRLGEASRRVSFEQYYHRVSIALLWMSRNADRSMGLYQSAQLSPARCVMPGAETLRKPR